MISRSSPLRRLGLLTAALSVALLTACASPGKLPQAELSAARASLSQAESAGALQLAPVELLMARDKFAKAEAAAREERYVDSRRFAEQAAADAEVAERKSRATKSMRAVEELDRANAALLKETQRKP